MVDFKKLLEESKGTPVEAMKFSHILAKHIPSKKKVKAIYQDVLKFNEFHRKKERGMGILVNAITTKIHAGKSPSTAQMNLLRDYYKLPPL